MLNARDAEIATGPAVPFNIEHSTFNIPLLKRPLAQPSLRET
jgi:hypothetical protein